MKCLILIRLFLWIITNLFPPQYHRSVKQNTCAETEDCVTLLFNINKNNDGTLANFQWWRTSYIDDGYCSQNGEKAWPQWRNLQMTSQPRHVSAMASRSIAPVTSTAFSRQTIKKTRKLRLTDLCERIFTSYRHHLACIWVYSSKSLFNTEWFIQRIC